MVEPLFSQCFTPNVVKGSRVGVAEFRAESTSAFTHDSRLRTLNEIWSCLRKFLNNLQNPL